MKKRMIKPLLTIACLLSSISASAHDFEVNGLQYDIMSLSDLTCKIVGLSANNKCSGNYVIPSHVNYLNKTLTVVEVKENLFSGCSEMTGIIIPNTIEEIGGGAFSHCTNLTSLTIGKSVTEMEENVCFNCTALSSIYSLNTTPPNIDPDSFTRNQYLTTTVYVPEEALKAYQNAEGWKNFWNLQGFDATGIDGVKMDGVNGDSKYYDLRGNRLDAPKRGINIINGKKVIVK